MSLYSMARISRLNLLELQKAETHARRLDQKSQARRVRDVPPVAWLQPGTEDDPLALSRRYSAHVAGAFIPKGKAKVLHLLVKFPESVPVASAADAEIALQLAVEFAQDIFGGDAVFAARMDRDEKSLTNADVFIAPRYVKKTKHTEKLAISLTRHLKLMAEKRGLLTQDKDVLRTQGRALQDAFSEFLRERGYQAIRGKKKESTGPDWNSPEAYGVATDRQISAADRYVADQDYQQAATERDAIAIDRTEIECRLAEREQTLEVERLDLETEKERVLAEAHDAADALNARSLAAAEQMRSDERARLEATEHAAITEADRVVKDAIAEAARTVEAANDMAANITAEAKAAAEKSLLDAELEADRIGRLECF